jgi:ribosomal protein S18 acetylase RimI-like enzyme
MYSNLKHVKFGNDFKGIILIDKNKFVGIIQCNVVSKYIVALEVASEYRNMGIAKYLLKYAVNLDFQMESCITYIKNMMYT